MLCRGAFKVLARKRLANRIPLTGGGGGLSRALRRVSSLAGRAESEVALSLLNDVLGGNILYACLHALQVRRLDALLGRCSLLSVLERLVDRFNLRVAERVAIAQVVHALLAPQTGSRRSGDAHARNSLYMIGAERLQLAHSEVFNAPYLFRCKILDALRVKALHQLPVEDVAHIGTLLGASFISRPDKLVERAGTPYAGTSERLYCSLIEFVPEPSPQCGLIGPAAARY